MFVRILTVYCNKFIVRKHQASIKHQESNKHQVYSKKEKKPIGKRQLKWQPSQNWNNYLEYIRITETQVSSKKLSMNGNSKDIPLVP